MKRSVKTTDSKDVEHRWVELRAGRIVVLLESDGTGIGDPDGIRLERGGTCGRREAMGWDRVDAEEAMLVAT